MLERSCSRPVPESPSSPHDGSSDDSGYFGSSSADEKYELYIPAPAHLNREDALAYHLTTRNFFAWMFQKPLVGIQLGKALIDLKTRMDEFRPDSEENEEDFLAYLHIMGYDDFRDCPDHALAVLKFAERFQLTELWTDAFAHAVGLYSRLVSSDEFISVSLTTKALITRANLEMELRLERASFSITSFMEDDLSGPYLGLSDPALRHSERFRSFLFSFYVQQHGYWPPNRMPSTVGKNQPLPKHLLLSMFSDFRNLYNFLADEYSYPDMSPGSDALYGGISTVHTINTFTKKHKFLPLPHPLPRLPATYFSEHYRQTSGSTFGSTAKLFLRTNKRAKEAKRAETIDALASATNIHDAKVVNCALVREYASFERKYTVRENERISAVEGRKIRWLLVYTMLQTLVSVTRTPEEVRDTEGVEYPLCCQTAGTPPWGFAKSPVSRALVDDPSLQTTKRIVTQSTRASPISLRDSAHVAPLDLARVRMQRNSAMLSPPTSPNVVDNSIIDPEWLVSSLRSRNFDDQRATPVSHAQTSPSQCQSPLPRNVKRLSSSTFTTTAFNQSPIPPPIRSPSLARTLTTRTNPVRCPQPRKPFDENLIYAYESTSSNPSSDAETSSLEGSAPTLIYGGDSEPGTPVSIISAQLTGTGPPSPSVYNVSPVSDTGDILFRASEDIPKVHYENDTNDTSEKRKSMHKREKSSQLARQFKEEIRWREGPGWDGEAVAMLRGE